MSNNRIWRYGFLGTLVIISFCSRAQSDSVVARPVYFYTVHVGGLLAKDSPPSFSVSTIHGMRHKRIAVGLGVGYDAFIEWRTLPVFASLTYDLATGANQNAFAPARQSARPGCGPCRRW